MLHANKFGSLCVRAELAYLMGDYSDCATIKLSSKMDIKCKYIKALCCIGNSEYDTARILLSEISTGTVSEISYHSMNSLTEIEFLKEDYAKAMNLANQANRFLAAKASNTYPYIVSELLLVKAYFDSKDSLSALRRIEMIKSLNTDGFIYESLNTNVY